MPIIKKDGFNFSFDPRACASCSGKCCHGRSGYIWINIKEMYIISEFLAINRIDFIQQYLRRVGNCYSLLEDYGIDGYKCIFFDVDRLRCSIYPVRPSQCRLYPFWDIHRTHWHGLIQECPGVKMMKHEK